MLIQNKYEVTEGKTAPDGTTILECGLCKKKFAVPSSEVVEDKDVMTICEECGKSADKAAVEASAASMKSKEAADTISKALGK